LWGRTVSRWSNGRVREAIESGRTAIGVMRTANDQWNLVDALAWTSFPLILSGRPDEMAEGQRFAIEGVELGQRLGNRGGEVLCQRGVGMAQVFGGSLDVFERAAQVDLEGFEGIKSPWVSQSHLMVAMVAVLRGDLDAALDPARKGMELEPVSAWSGIGNAYCMLVHAWRGDIDECRRLLEEGRRLLPEAGRRPSIGQILNAVTTVQACVVAGLPEEAGALYPLVVGVHDDLPVSGFDLALCERIAGMAAAAAERWDDAVQHFEGALRRAVEIGDDLDLPQVEHWFGVMLLDRGQPEDRARARELLTSAIERYQALGMPLYEARARQALERA
jgi:tetratricopeptide (TPR) repeat protein